MSGNFVLEEAIDILERTPHVVEQLLGHAPSRFVVENEGENTWSPYDVVAHLIHADKTDWMERVEVILNGEKRFPPFDRHGHDKDMPISAMLDEFKRLRERTVSALRDKKISLDDQRKTGIHPQFGEVTLAQLLSTWVAHDLCHLSQITRVMAKRYKSDVGPWVEYLPTLSR